MPLQSPGGPVSLSGSQPQAVPQALKAPGSRLWAPLFANCCPSCPPKRTAYHAPPLASCCSSVRVATTPQNTSSVFTACAFAIRFIAFHEQTTPPLRFAPAELLRSVRPALLPSLPHIWLGAQTITRAIRASPGPIHPSPSSIAVSYTTSKREPLDTRRWRPTCHRQLL